MTTSGRNIYAQIETSKEELESFVQSAKNGDWQYVKCVYCGKIISIFDADFHGGDPACKNRSCDYYG